MSLILAFFCWWSSSLSYFFVDVLFHYCFLSWWSYLVQYPFAGCPLHCYIVLLGSSFLPFPIISDVHQHRIPLLVIFLSALSCWWPSSLLLPYLGDLPKCSFFCWWSSPLASYVGASSSSLFIYWWSSLLLIPSISNFFSTALSFCWWLSFLLLPSVEDLPQCFVLS